MKISKSLLVGLIAWVAGPASALPVDGARIVALHNAERAAVHTPPLAWDEALAADAAIWARNLARAGRIWHDPQNRREGENIWMGTRGAYSIDEMIGDWAHEKADLPDPAHWLENHAAVGHYTQMIWSTTSDVGCAIASDRDSDFLVCRYSPPGNVVGKSPF